MHYHNLDKIILPITEAQDVYTFIEKKKKKSTFSGSWHKATYLGNSFYLFLFFLFSKLFRKKH